MTLAMPLEFIEWLYSYGFKDLKQFKEYLSTINSIEIKKSNPNWNVIADSNRPYLHLVFPMNQNEGLYIGVQGQSKQVGLSDYDWASEKPPPIDSEVWMDLPFNEYTQGANSYFGWIGTQTGAGQTPKNLAKVFNDLENQITSPGFRYTQPVWNGGGWGGDGHGMAWYLDEIMDKGINIVAMNWLDNPLEKNIKEHRLYLKEEKKKLATLKRKEKIDSELSSYANYKTRKEIKFNNKKIEFLKGKCSDGIYFDLVKLNYIINKYRNNDVDIFALAKHNSFNIELTGILQQMNNLTNPNVRVNNQNGWWPQFHRFMIDLCGDGYNLKSSYEGWNNQITNWTTWGLSDIGSVWFIELMNSGLDLSYYIVDEVDTSHYGIIKVAEDTLIFDFNKKGGPLSKSKYYNYIRKGIEWSSKPNWLLPKWMFIEYKGGKCYEL